MNERGETNMATVTIQEAQAKLSDLIHRLTPGEEVVITENNEPVAKAGGIPTRKAAPPARPLQGDADHRGGG